MILLLLLVHSFTNVMDESKKPSGLPVRWGVAFLAFIGFIFNYMLRVNINVTIVAMVNFTAFENDEKNITVDECKFDDDDELNPDETSKSDQGQFLWDSVVQSQIVGSFYYGYIITQLPGGRMSELFGSKRVLGVSMAGVAILRLSL